MSLLDLHRLRVEYNERSHTWGVGFFAEKELLLARDTSGAYLVNHLASGGPKCLGLSVQVDDQLPPGRIELRDRDGRVLSAVEGI